MKLLVAFNTDPTGMSFDIRETINIPKDICLYDFHDHRLNVPNRLHTEVKKALIYKGHYIDSYFNLLKIYTVD